MKCRPEPRQRILLDLPVDCGGYAFNPTLLAGADGVICVYRHVAVDGIRTLRSCRLDEHFRPHDVRCWSDQARAAGAAQTWFADPRAFPCDGRYFVCFNTGHSEYPNGLYLVEVSPSGQPLRSPVELRKQDGRRSTEKNWGFFESDGKLYCIYSVSPFVVLEVAFDGPARTFAVHHWHSTAVERAYGSLRGGASPVRISDRFYMVVQSHIEENGKLWYYGSLVVFDASPPFRPLLYATAPLFELADDERHIRSDLPLHPPVVECLYPTGAISMGDELLIAYGINDFRSGLRIYSTADLERALVPVVLTSPAEGNDSPSAPRLSVLRSFFWEPSLQPRRTLADVASGGLRVGNAGDSLQRLIATRLFGMPCLNTDERGRRLLGIGSIAHRMRAGDVIWGSGHKPVAPNITAAEAATVQAIVVRGPLTLSYLEGHGVNVATVRAYFDPGLLLGQILADEVAALRARAPTLRDVLYIPHYSDTLRFEALYRRAGRRVTTMDQDILSLVVEILAADLVVSSSLHGLIFAEALGVPAILHCPPPAEHRVKYIDYYEGTGRPTFPVLEDEENPSFVHGPDLPRIPLGWQQTIPSFNNLWNAGIVIPVLRLRPGEAAVPPATACGALPAEVIIDVADCYNDNIVLSIELSKATVGHLLVLHGDRVLGLKPNKFVAIRIGC